MHLTLGTPPASLLGTDVTGAALTSALIDEGPTDRFTDRGALAMSWVLLGRRLLKAQEAVAPAVRWRRTHRYRRGLRDRRDRRHIRIL
jgi:hypothetical protein